MGTDTEALADVASAMGELKDDEQDLSLEAPKDPRAKKPTVKTVRKIYVWLPMAFPEVPEKGDFDVRRLRASKYFFH